MKTTLKKFIRLAVLGVALTLQSLPTWAGSTYIPEVQVGSGFAHGSMVGARYSSDTLQHITCIAHNPAVTCSARDKTGKYFVCNRIDAEWAAVVRSITDSSNLHFAAAKGTATCNYLRVDNLSYHLK